MKKHYRIGVSSGVLLHKMELDKLLLFEPDVVEFYNYTSKEVAEVNKFCKKNNVRQSLHTPTPYDEMAPLQRFCSTGPDLDETNLAIKLTKQSIQLASEVDATHVVVHFPSPYADAPRFITNDHITYFFDPVVALADRLGVRLLIENMTTHPTFNSPKDYLRVLEAYPGAGICLDLGHAFMLNGHDSVYEFIDVLASYIHSIHIYGIERVGEGFVKSFLSAPDGYGMNDNRLDIEGVINTIKTTSMDPIFIIEYPGCDDVQLAEAVRSKAWLQQLLQ